MPVFLVAIGLAIVLIPAVVELFRGWLRPAGREKEFHPEDTPERGGTVEDVQKEIQKSVGLVFSKLAREALQDRRPRDDTPMSTCSRRWQPATTTPGFAFTSA